MFNTYKALMPLFTLICQRAPGTGITMRTLRQHLPDTEESVEQTERNGNCHNDILQDHQNKEPIWNTKADTTQAMQVV